MKKTVLLMLLPVIGVMIATVIYFIVPAREVETQEATSPSHDVEAPEAATPAQDTELQETVSPWYDISTEDAVEYMGGKVFQAHSHGDAAGIGEIMYFVPDSNEYYWFCSSMDQQSRLRAEYGTWELNGGFIDTKTQSIVEWVGGSFSKAYGSTGSRYELENYEIVISDYVVECVSNFHMFEFANHLEQDALGFYAFGKPHYYITSFDDELNEYIDKILQMERNGNNE